MLQRERKFITILGASPAPNAVKAMAKQKLLGEEVVTRNEILHGKARKREKKKAK